jgi:hypothetical protein
MKRTSEQQRVFDAIHDLRNPILKKRLLSAFQEFEAEQSEHGSFGVSVDHRHNDIFMAIMEVWEWEIPEKEKTPDNRGRFRNIASQMSSKILDVLDRS